MHFFSILRSNRRRPKRNRSGRRLRFQTLEGRRLLNGDFGFATTFGGLGARWDNDFASSVATDEAGNVYTTGYFQGTADFDPGPGIAELSTHRSFPDTFVTKQDFRGNLIWARNIGIPAAPDEGRGIVADKAGNVYVTGTARGAFVTKLDRSGNTIWQKTFSGDGYEIDGKDIAVDDDGNVYTTGNFRGTVDFDPGDGTANLTNPHPALDGFVVKLDRDGNYVWASSFGGESDDYGSGIALDGAANVYVTGHFADTVDFDPGPGAANLASHGLGDAFVLKVDTNGDFVWSKAMGGARSDDAADIAVDQAGNIYTTGNFVERADFDPGPAVAFLETDGAEAFVSKLDADGNFVWAKAIAGPDGSYGDGIAVDPLGNVYTAGWFHGLGDFDPGIGSFNLQSNGDVDAFISILDSSGALVSAQAIGGAGDDRFEDIAVDRLGNVYLTGFFNDTVDFDPGPGTQIHTSLGGYDAFVLQLTQPGLICDTIVTNVNDDGPGSLRAAIACANAAPGLDTIEFDIFGEGVHTIQSQSPLPTITDPVVIDGSTQASGESTIVTSSLVGAAPAIEIDGSLAGEGASGLKINRRGGGSTIRGLIINRFDAHGIFISRSDGNHVEQNYIGTDATGTMDRGNGDAGVMILNGADNVIGGSMAAGHGNVVSANRRGIVIAGRLASGNQVLGNLIGVDASGAVALGNRGAGVEISGAPNNHIGASVATVDGINVISGNRVGVEIRSGAAIGNTLALNKIGTDLSATAVLPNRIGVSIRNGAAENDVRGNLISGNSHDGVKITRANDNHIGSNRIGHQSLGNGGDGVDIRDGQNNLIGRNVAPAPAAAARLLFAFIGGNSIAANAGYGVNVVGDGNVIEANTIGTSTTGNEGNQRGGVQILNSSDNVVRHNAVFNNEGPGVLINGTTAEHTLVQGNRIGLSAAPKISDVPSSDVGNSVGIEIRGARNNLIGGTAEVEGNLITQNERYGVHIRGEASGNRIEGNQIGTATFTFELPPIWITADSHTATLVFPPVEYQPTTITRTTTPNRRDGIFVEADGNVIGGSAEGAGNVISGNGRHGVLIKGDSNRVEGNRIGPVATGFHDIPNGADGVRVHGSNNIIGGSETGAGNKISLNGVSGIRVSSGTGNVISQNSVFDNGGLGIDLGRQGTNANDAPLDADRGANNLQNAPEIFTTRRSDTHLQIIFRIPSQPPHSTFPIRAEFFLADDDGEEGKTSLASTDVALFTPTAISIPLTDIPAGAQIVATATDAEGNTSEFSAPLAAESPAATMATQQAADLIFQDLGQ